MSTITLTIFKEWNTNCTPTVVRTKCRLQDGGGVEGGETIKVGKRTSPRLWCKYNSKKDIQTKNKKVWKKNLNRLQFFNEFKRKELMYNQPCKRVCKQRINIKENTFKTNKLCTSESITLGFPLKIFISIHKTPIIP